MLLAVYLVVLFFAPLAFGSTELWSMATVELLAALTGLLCFAPFLSDRRACRKIPGIAPLLLLLCWMLFQCIPLPVQLIRLISPNTVAVYQPALELQPAATWIPLTVNRQATLLEVLRFSAYALFYVLTVLLLSDSRKKLSATVASIGWLVLFIAFASMLQRSVAPSTLFWLRKLQDSQGSFGPWVYKNHYAGFMVMTSPLLLALFLLHRPVVAHGQSFRKQLSDLLSDPKASMHAFFGFGVIVVLASILRALSRGGILSMAFALLLFFFMLARRRRKRPILSLLALAGCLALAGGWFSWEALVERFRSILASDAESISISDDRLLVWRDVIGIIVDFPFSGTGFGTFVDIFPSYKTVADNLIYDHAHNDYLELLAEGGLTGFFLAAWFVGTTLKTGMRQIFVRRDRLAVLAAIAAFSGISGLLFYSITDFNLHNGANGLYFFFLCGLLISAGHVRRHGSSLLAPASSPVETRAVGFAAASILLLATLWMQGGGVAGARHYQQARRISASMQRQEKKLSLVSTLIELAAQSNPFNGSYFHVLAKIRMLQKQNEQALLLHAKASLRQPLESTFLQSAGLMLASSKPDKARLLLRSSHERAQDQIEYLVAWMEFELSHDNRNEAIRRLHETLEQHPEQLPELYPFLTEHRFTREEMTAALPELTSAWLVCSNLANAAGSQADAGYFAERALEFLDKEPRPQAHFFMQVHNYYQQQKQEDKSAEVLRQGLKVLPDHAPLHSSLAEHYLRQGFDERALEEYEKALSLDPENADLQSRTRQLKDRMGPQQGTLMRRIRQHVGRSGSTC